MFKSVKQIIKKNEEIKTKEYKIFLEIEKEYKKTQKKQIKKNLIVYDFKDEELILKAASPAWRNEGSLLKEEIKKNF